MYKLNLELINGMKLKLEIPAEMVSALAVERPIAAGDVNGDGQMDEKDAEMIMGHLSGDVVLDSEQVKRADVDGDGKITYVDAMSVMDKANGV